MERLDKLLASTGLWSRREIKEVMSRGRVAVDGTIIKKPETKCDPQTAVITVEGNVIACVPFVYVMMHKPAGVLSATEDRKQETVLDLLPKHLQKRGLFPVGRLDKDTEGLLILTDDGIVAHRLLSPKHHVDKVYYAKIDGILNPDYIPMFAEGMVLGDGLHCQPAQLEILEDGTACYVTLQEGKFHQVKRMLAACETPVIYLKRLKMGGVSLDNELHKGEWRFLSTEELKTLKEA